MCVDLLYNETIVDELFIHWRNGWMSKVDIHVRIVVEMNKITFSDVVQSANIFSQKKMF